MKSYLYQILHVFSSLINQCHLSKLSKMFSVCQRNKNVVEKSNLSIESQKAADLGDSKFCKEDKGKKQQQLKEEIAKTSIVHGGRALIIARRARLKRLFDHEAIEIKNILRAMGYAFIPTQP